MENIDLIENPYAPPNAELENPKDTSEHFYVVSIQKFTVLFLSTIGLYTIYWFYANWKRYRYAAGYKIWPIPRAIFSIFFAHSLFDKVQTGLKRRGQEYKWMPSTVATLYVIIAILGNVMDSIAVKGIWSPYSDVLSVLSVFALYFILVKPQRAINLSEGDPGGISNSSFNVVNYVWVGLGLVIWSFVIIGLVYTFGLA
ncbi:MAG: hypothetical protein KZQ65_04715 [Candidatus Thiodiazotropha sp. (ex Gloverina cf. vestifex)]|nr:hypothetical protein [Candidatus Thiodiazotropha sp. (ex Gloverina cf. vestifex)]